MDARQPDADEPRSVKQSAAIAVLSLLGLLTVGFLVHREWRADRPYRVHQERARALLARATGQAQPLDLRIRQVAGDRCPSCHLVAVGVGEEGVNLGRVPAGVPNPYRRHPGRLLAPEQHPPRRFGCTTCHGAGGAYLDRCLPARGDPDGRALDRRHVAASCRACHAPAEELPGAERLTLGLRAYRRLGCGGCHRAAGIDAGRASGQGPPLDGVAGKLDVGFLRSFLADPQQLRPGTAMPSFFSEAALRGAPAFTVERRRRERVARQEDLVAFLLAQGASQPAEGVTASPAAGRARFVRLGCVVCHLAGGPPHADLGGVGPDLRRAGTRLHPVWIRAWLRRPTLLRPETRMPDPRLSAEERAELAAYLAGLGGPASAPPPASDARRAGPASAPPPASDARRAARGRAVAEKLGCAGCHAVAALRGVAPAGPELDGFGDKPLELLDWGHAPLAAAERSFWRWTELKLTEPLRFDRRPGVLLMPWQQLRAGELEGLLVVLRSLVAERTSHMVARVAERDRRRREGERLVEELSCRRCHVLGELGGRGVASLLPLPADRPPSLDGEGVKVQPAWLNDFLARPTALRPWLGMRMPTPNATSATREALAAYLAARDSASYPFYVSRPVSLDGPRLDEALALFSRFQCLRCHLLSNAGRLKPGELSPDLALSGSRLRREWIYRFILEPQQLMPGTKMPTLFPLADEDDPRSRTTPLPSFCGGSVERQIEALTELNIWWGSAAAARREGGVRRR